MEYNLFDYNIKVNFNKEDQDYIAFIEEVPECSAFGSSPDKAIKELETAYQLWKETVKEKGYTVPEPAKKTSKDIISQLNDVREQNKKYSFDEITSLVNEARKEVRKKDNEQKKFYQWSEDLAEKKGLSHMTPEEIALFIKQEQE